ncbi:hypothetical protein TWF694_003177 [Orbilia ellipsospora]|uniref:Vacuolar import and degradation protein 21 n=1 Tax=Orbilia ellipsospora TaxID=2528407 RepID=A0AAV9X1Q6_9PEZI
MASTETLARLGKKREALDKIVSSRKRKLQELYRVVNHVQLSCTATRGGRTGGSVGRLGWDEDGERLFLESTDINLGKAFNANEMLPKSTLVVPDIVREALKSIVPAVQKGDISSTVITKGEGSATSNEGTKPTEGLNVPNTRDTPARRSLTPKPSTESENVTSNLEDSMIHVGKTPVRRVARQKPPSTEEPNLRQDGSYPVVSKEGAKESKVEAQVHRSQKDAKDTIMEDARPTVAKPFQESVPLPEGMSESAKSQSVLSPIKPTDKVTPPPLQRTTSQKSEQPNLAISTQASPQDQISRPFPTPTTATETEHSLRPPVSVPEKSISPPSPADSATIDTTADDNTSKVSKGLHDEGDNVDKDREVEDQPPSKLPEIQTESTINEQEGLEPKSADEVMGEVEKQLQVETALSKQQEIPKEEQIVNTDDAQQLSQAEDATAKLSDAPLSEDIEMGDASAEEVDTTDQDEVVPEPAAVSIDIDSQIKDTSEATQISDSGIGSQEPDPIKAAEKIDIPHDAENETAESSSKKSEEKEHAIPSSRETAIPANIKREEQTPLETIESSANIALLPDQNLSATPSVIPATPHHITHDTDALDGSAIAETPMSVEEPTGHTTSPKFVQQPLTTAALESINTTASTPATRASSRREKRPSITGGLQLAKIVFHGRSTATSSKSDANPNDLSPSAPTPIRVGTRSGSISTPTRMNSRSLEAQRINSLAELRDQHQSQARQQSAQHHKSNSEKPKLDVFDYLTAVTASEPLQNSLATSHKTLSTSAFQLLRREKQAIQALTEIQELQKAGKWSLTQPAKAIEPPKQFVHWDYLLMEAKWMSKDFKEDRKWNIVRAKKLADACSAWHQANPEERKAMCIRTTGDSSSARNSRHVRQMPTPNEHSDDDAMRDDDDDGDENMRDDFVHRLHEVENPGNLFALGADDIIFEILHNSMTDRMLGELPIFEAPKLVDGSGKVRESIFFDGWKNNEPLAPSGLKRTLWETPAEEGPPVKKSRFSYDPEYRLLDSDDEDEENREPIRRVGGPSRGIARSGSPVLQPENTAVALFNPDFQPVLQRLHNAHPFRPPQEMPPATFFEYRAPSQWTAEEDKELVNTVRKYNHNWWLVSQVMQPRSFLQSGADRRSLWECFERWFMLDPQNQELIKGPFFKPVQQRLELASRAPTLATATQQQAANNATAATPGGANTAGQSSAGGAGATANTPSQPPKRRTSQPMRVERKRSTRTLNMIEQMRKLAKKREVQASKQAQSTSIALKKQQEQSAQAAAAPKSEQYTPLQVSRMKHERELLHRQQAQMAQMAQLQRRQAQTQPSSSSATQAQPSQASTTGATASGSAAASTPTAVTPVQTTNNIPVQSRTNLQVPGVQSTPAAAVPTTAQQSLLAAQQQRSLMSANSSAAVQAATQQVNQHLRAQGHTIASNGQNGPTSLTPEQYRMLIQARMQANAIKMQQAQAQAQAAQAQAQAAAAAGHGSPQSVSASANHLHAMQAAAAAARAHNSNAGQAGQVIAGSSGANRGDLISPQQAMMRIKQSFPTIGDEYVHRMIMQHQAQAKQLGKELTHGHISNLIASLASQFQGVGQQQAVAAAQQQQAQLQQAAAVAQQQQQQQQQQAAAAQVAAAHHHQQGHSQSPPHPGMVGVAHVGAGGIHHPHPPISRGGASAAAQQMLNQLMISQTRAPSSSPMMGNATPVMSSAGVVSRGSSATPMQRGGSYHTPTPGPAGTSAGAMGQQGSPRIGQSQMPNGGQ